MSALLFLVFSLSPSNFNSWNAHANVWNVNSTGNLNPWNSVANGNGVRPDSYYKLVILLMNRILLIKVNNKRK